MTRARRLFGALLLVALVAACGGDDDESAAPTTETTADETTTTEADEDDDGGSSARLDGPTAEGEVRTPPYGSKDEEPQGEEREGLLRGFTSERMADGDAPAQSGGSPSSADGVRPLAGSIASSCVSCEGLLSIYQQDNFAPAPVDADRSCGQAAIATVLTFYGKLPQDDSGQTVTDIWNAYEPNVPGDGTNWDQMQRAIEGYGMNAYWGTGEEELKSYIRGGRPAIVMVDVGAVSNRWGGHWIVAYAFDDYGIYVTNWAFGTTRDGYLTWGEFRTAWGLDPNPNSAWIVKGAGVSNRFLLAW